MRKALTILLALQPSLAAAQWRAPPQDLRSEVLAAHNMARARHGVAPLVWSEALAASATVHASFLARTNRFEHDATPGRRKREGENLWREPRGVYGPRRAMNDFLGEERRFRPGVFPAISTSGNWLDVSHFTQMIWPNTTAVGCAIAANTWYDTLVCRYAPPGNKDGVALR